MFKIYLSESTDAEQEAACNLGTSFVCEETTCETPTPSDEGVEQSPGTPTSLSEGECDSSSTVGTTEETPFQCDLCKLAFSKLSYLKKHSQVRGFG